MSDVTSEAVWRPLWPQNIIFFVGLQLMEVLNLLLTMSQFLQNTSKNFQKSPRNSPKILKNLQKISKKSNSPFSSMSAATLLGPNLVSIGSVSSSLGDFLNAPIPHFRFWESPLILYPDVGSVESMGDFPICLCWLNLWSTC